MKKSFLHGILFISIVQLFACGSLSYNFADEFSRRERQFLSCPGAQLKTAKPKKIHCPTNFPGICYYSCLKCASTSLLFTFQPERRVILRECDFKDIHSLILFKRDIMDRFMSAYGQITYQEYKREFKKEQAIRNGYGKLSPTDNPEERFSLFVSAYENEKRRPTIPDFYHADSIFSMYKNLHYCLIHAEQRPRVYIIKVEDIENELQALGQILNVSFPALLYVSKNSATKVKRDCEKCEMQKAAKNTKFTLAQRERVLNLYKDDITCFG